MTKRKSRIGKVIAVIPDTQLSPGVPMQHLEWIGNYLAEKKPDTIIQLGDWADMTSLNSYTVGKAEHEGKRYVKDIDVARKGMEMLLKPIRRERKYKPEMLLTLGNHEDRINREAELNPKFQGAISTDDLGYTDFGWKVSPFLEVVTVCDWQFSHFFTSGAMGRPVSSAAALLRQRMASAVMGHVQFSDVSLHRTTGHTGIFAGLCALHDEKYLNPQGNRVRRQIVMLNEVEEGGQGDHMFVSLRFLERRYS